MLGQNLIIRGLVGNRLVGGTWTASGTWTIPAVTLGGTATLNGQVFDAGAVNAQINTTGAEKGLLIQCTNDGAVGALIKTDQVSASPANGDILMIWEVYGRNSAGGSREYGDLRFSITDVTDTSEDGDFGVYLIKAGSLTNVLSLTSVGSLNIPSTGAYRFGGTQVVGARVVDARADDVVDSTYGAEEAGVLDALRDAMISHGLISAS